MVQFRDDSKNTNNQPGVNPLVGKPQSVKNAQKADTSRDLHLYSDVDVSPTAQHHTIGNNATQVAAGNHRHEGLYSSAAHIHDPSDIIPPIEVPDEVIVQDTDPFVADPTLPVGTLWIDSSKPDANPEVISATWGTDKKSVTTTTFSHPVNWGTLLYVPPADGMIDVWCWFEMNTSGLLNARWAMSRLRILDSTDTLVKGHTSQDPRTGIYTWFNHVVAPVTAGEQYKVSMQFALSHTNGTTFDVSDPVCYLKYIPDAAFSSTVLTTIP